MKNIQILAKEKCCGCEACANKCTRNAISMQKDDRGFYYPAVSNDLCTDCGLCVNVCPILSKEKSDMTAAANHTIHDAYAVQALNKTTLFHSTSGGIAFELAAEVIRTGGVVFGVCYSKDFEVCHRKIETMEELANAQGSKYVQSRIDSSFLEAKQILDEGRNVYFTGTACQIEGLLSFLGKKYDNLITQDIICHGVPSPGFWEKYLKEQGYHNAQQIIFREKSKGWGSKSEFTVRLKNGKEKRMPFSQNDYCYYFVNNYSLRPICFSCPFKEYDRKSDFTVADLWGIEEILPEKSNDTSGFSFLTVRSEKGRRLFESIKDKIFASEIPYEKAVANNMMMLKSVNKPDCYEQFWHDAEIYSCKKLNQKYKQKDSFVLSVKKKLYPLKQKLLK